MHIKEIMSHPVVTCPIDSTADAPARLMWEFDCGIVPVVDKDGRVAGVITDRDICMAALTQNKPLREVQTASAMAKNVVSCHPDDSIESAEHLMRDHRIRRVPVIDNDGRPAGLLALNDLSRLAARARKSGVDRELVETMAAVCQPRGHAVSVTPPSPSPVHVSA